MFVDKTLLITGGTGSFGNGPVAECPRRRSGGGSPAGSGADRGPIAGDEVRRVLASQRRCLVAASSPEDGSLRDHFAGSAVP